MLYWQKNLQQQQQSDKKKLRVQCIFTLNTRLESSGLKPIEAERPFCGAQANSADSDQMPQNVRSDQGLYCLLTDCSIKI